MLDTLSIARQEYMEGRFNRGGIVCRCCNRRGMIHKRRLTKSMAQALVLLRRFTIPGEWVHWQTLLRQRKAKAAGSGMPAMLRWWGLVEEKPKERNGATVRGAKTSGYWRITDAGVAFVDGISHVPSHCFEYRDEIFGFSDTPVGIRDALEDFNYDELMNSGGPPNGRGNHGAPPP